MTAKNNLVNKKKNITNKFVNVNNVGNRWFPYLTGFRGSFRLLMCIEGVYRF